MPEPDCFLRYRRILREMRGFTMVLFTEPVSRGNTFVGGECAPPSALLVVLVADSVSVFR